MCEYCNEVNYEPLIKAEEQLDIEAGVAIYAKESRLVIDLLYEASNELNSKSIKINYCPMCGRFIGEG